MQRRMFQWLGLAVLTWVGAAACCCAPREPSWKAGQTKGTYMASANRLFADDGDFDLRKRVIYYAEKKAFDPGDMGLPDPEFTANRCSWCHECGFKRAWDIDNVGKPNWKPRYRGEAWGPIVQRMRVMDGSLLNEQIAKRIYSYLRDASTGKYDPAKDSHGAVVRVVDEIPTNVEIESPGRAAQRQKEESEQQRKDREQTESGGQ